MRMFIVAAVAVSLASPVTAAELSKGDKAYIVIALSGLVALKKCDGYEVVPNSMEKIGDVVGASDTTFVAMGEYMKLQADMSYDRSLLIPEVSQYVTETWDGLANWTKPSAKDFCKKMAPTLVERGVIKKKN